MFGTIEFLNTVFIHSFVLTYQWWAFPYGSTQRKLWEITINSCFTDSCDYLYALVLMISGSKQNCGLPVIMTLNQQEGGVRFKVEVALCI